MHGGQPLRWCFIDSEGTHACATVERDHLDGKGPGFCCLFVN